MPSPPEDAEGRQCARAATAPPTPRRAGPEDRPSGRASAAEEQHPDGDKKTVTDPALPAPILDSGRALSLRRPQPGRHPARLGENLIAGPHPGDGALEPRIAEREGQAREQVKVSTHGGADEGEEGVHGLAVESAEIHRLLEEAERDHGSRDVENDGIADGDRDPVADWSAPWPRARSTRESQSTSPNPHRLHEARKNRFMILPLNR
jgi:hypothetical protein